jgi:hypothetical protein
MRLYQREVQGNKLTALFRVIPGGRESVHFIQNVDIPEISELRGLND